MNYYHQDGRQVSIPTEGKESSITESNLHKPAEQKASRPKGFEFF